jgi:hypothetical protein
METLEQIEQLMATLKEDATKFFEKNNKSAGIRTRKTAQTIKSTLQDLRKIVLEESKK